jgi:Ca2+-binding EF-hand superfamily protein
MNTRLLFLSLFAVAFADELDVEADESSMADMTDAEYEEMFNELDENSDGKLTLTEVMDSLQAELEEEFGDEVPAKLKELLTAADGDKNEELNKAELLAFVEKTQEYLESLEMSADEDDEEDPSEPEDEEDM